ncbi:hypothetical protein DPMN_180146 [Dreissena polymorpha]|uniref:Uncharacterized protein n=1 Tax=Dreissena polymorpha TaxID=45954 RepID=A0A9D4EHK6_DREPO|nr:hypothetical protein DPMN_180146 [Dreissena polymorpha]
MAPISMFQHSYLIDYLTLKSEDDDSAIAAILEIRFIVGRCFECRRGRGGKPEHPDETPAFRYDEHQTNFHSPWNEDSIWSPRRESRALSTALFRKPPTPKKQLWLG